MKGLWSAAVFCAAVVSANAAAAPDGGQDVLAQMRRLYASGQYDSTIAIGRAYLKKHGTEPQTEFLVPLLMEALVRTNDAHYFERLRGIYEQKFPSSDFLPRVQYLEGVMLGRQEKQVDAVLAFSRCLWSGAAAPLDSLAVRNVKLLCEKSLSADELGRLAGRADLHPRIAEVVSFYEFTKLYESDQVSTAKYKAELFKKKYPDSRLMPFAKDVISKSKSAERSQIPLGLLAPVSGADADAGKQLVQAVQLAVDQYNDKNGAQIRLVIGDTKGSSVRTAQLTNEMVKVDRVPAIIGPLASTVATVTAAMLMDKDIVMVSPTATDEGIATLGRNIFQLNLTPGTLGRRIASYAFDNLNIREFAIIAPQSDYGHVLSESFKEEVLRKGGQIVDEEYFSEGVSDFRPQFDALRTKLLARRREKMEAEKGLGYNTPAATQRSRRNDSLCLADSTLSIGGLFMPAEAEDVVGLAPQVSFFRIQTQVLGTAGWYSPSVLLDGKQYVDDAIISTSPEIDPADEAWKAFSAAYRSRYSADPDRVVSPLAYDAANLVLSAVKAQGEDPRGIADYLHGVQNYHGVSGIISFDKTGGVNTETAIIKIKDKKFIRIQ